MKVLYIGMVGAVLVSLASCGTGLGGKPIDYGSSAVQTQKLEVPPDLTTPNTDDRYKMPQGDVGTVATFSDYSKGGTPRGRSASAVLPEVKGVHLEHDGARRWLAVDDKAENVWPVVKTFWQENGLAIKSEDPAAGVMETDWAENRAKIPEGGLRKLIGKVFDGIYSSNQRDQYRTRLERSKDGASTEVYISHRGMEEVFSDDKSTSKWQMRPNDPEMEAIMLQRLMARFGVSEAQAASAVAAVSSVAASPTTGNASEPAGTASLREIADGSSIIVVNDPFDRAWRKVGLAIESAGLAIEDKDRDKGVYFLRQVKIESSFWDKLKFWKPSENTNKHYHVNVKDGGAVCEVSIADQDGASNKATKQMIEAVYKNINQ